MELRVLGSDSTGNGYALMGREEILILECGIPFRRMLRLIDHRRRDVVGVLVSHSHGDHARHLNDYIINCRWSIFSNLATLEKKKVGNGWVKANIVSNEEVKQIGGFTVKAFSVKHDVDNFAYLIKHPEMGSMLFATDTYMLPYNFTGINHWLIEANYDDNILDENVAKGIVTHAEAARLRVSHFSIDKCIDTIRRSREHDLFSTHSITLIHLSGRNSSSSEFKQRIEEEFGVPCRIARRNLKYELL